MKQYFSFNSHTHDLWEIYEAIKKHYPIGIRKNEGRGIYGSYPGLKEYEKALVENIHDDNNYRTHWVRFTDEIGQEFGKEMQGTTYGQAPSFSAFMILEKHQFGDCIHSKELHFAVSLLGNFFQIYGVDATKILDKKAVYGRAYSSINVITPSPHEEFKTPFEFVEKKIREKYPSYKIVPFNIGQGIIKGLEVRYLDDEDCSINKALFNWFLSEEIISGSTRGDIYYGMNDWKKTE